MPMILPKYIIVMASDSIYYSKTANDIKELMIELITHYYKPDSNIHQNAKEDITLFAKALNGMESNEDCIVLFHKFTNKSIKGIYEINRTIYTNQNF